MKSAVTISLVPEAKGGPFVFWDDLALGCEHANKLGFDAVEIFPTSAESLDVKLVRNLLAKHRLRVSALGTGAGWVKHKLRLTDPDPAIRRRAREFVSGIVAVAGELGAPAIIGSMQGRCEPGANRPQVLEWLGEALEELSGQSAQFDQVLLYEPLNRYETDVFTRQGEAADFLRKLRSKNVRLLCDLFHMNIEESSIADTLLEAGPLVGHIHWVDSNRQAMGFGHTEAAPIIAALRAIGYTGYLSAEVFPSPNGIAAAQQSLDSFRCWTSPS
ncbi:MAG TPA: sugar phosphate isomerase/epimerase family protein [Verrucomicrobiae bacterium]|jgi:sugar phosphate isomerase/epimerase|nr:sugar phosphate isomerase/epimerase family protein [Verrucomicrobiae bacterium]